MSFLFCLLQLKSENAHTRFSKKEPFLLISRMLRQINRSARHLRKVERAHCLNFVSLWRIVWKTPNSRTHCVCFTNQQKPFRPVLLKRNAEWGEKNGGRTRLERKRWQRKYADMYIYMHIHRYTVVPSPLPTYRPQPTENAGPNPTITSCNANVVKIYNATKSILCL
jgi:hypothetical protein